MLICSFVLLAYIIITIVFHFFFFKQKTAYEMRISDWSSDVCSSDLAAGAAPIAIVAAASHAIQNRPRIVMSSPGHRIGGEVNHCNDERAMNTATIRVDFAFDGGAMRH